ncbi:MAG: GAF domain-containing protein [Oceanospirillaceae bacterium]|nr:GAF domain-containing protein [Oceanospirillaceae bacterium]
MGIKASSLAASTDFAGELTLAVLQQQNEQYRGSGGVSDGNRSLGFRPAFYDMDTGQVHPSRFANGLEAPMHVLDGLPDDLVVVRLESGRVTAVKPGVVAGFVRNGHFFTRGQAALATAQLKDDSQRLSNPDHHRALLDIWERFVRDPQYSSEMVRPVVEESWRRCHCQVDPELREAPLLADAQELESRRLRQSALLDAAAPVLKRAGELLFKADSLVLLADADGCVMDVEGDPNLRNLAGKVNLVEGARWDESSVGTNAIGTALAAAEPVQLFGAEHFCSGIKQYTCSADVVRDPHDGRILGVVDLSARTRNFQRHTLDFAITAARLIESSLARAYFACREDVLEGSRTQFLNWQSDGLLAFDRRGRLVKANRLAHRALEELGADVALTPQTRIDALDLEQGDGSSSVPAWLNPLWHQPILLRKRTVGTLVVVPCHH